MTMDSRYRLRQHIHAIATTCVTVLSIGCGRGGDVRLPQPSISDDGPEDGGISLSTPTPSDASKSRVEPDRQPEQIGRALDEASSLAEFVDGPVAVTDLSVGTNIFCASDARKAAKASWDKIMNVRSTGPVCLAKDNSTTVVCSMVLRSALNRGHIALVVRRADLVLLGVYIDIQGTSSGQRRMFEFLHAIESVGQTRC